MSDWMRVRTYTSLRCPQGYTQCEGGPVRFLGVPRHLHRKVFPSRGAPRDRAGLLSPSALYPYVLLGSGARRAHTWGPTPTAGGSISPGPISCVKLVSAHAVQYVLPRHARPVGAVLHAVQAVLPRAALPVGATLHAVQAVRVCCVPLGPYARRCTFQAVRLPRAEPELGPWAARGRGVA